jgi:lipid-A-disaccharide synthase
MSALKKKLDGAVRFAGIGGPRMVAEGLSPLFSQSELAHFGLFEVLRHIPHILKRINQTVADIETKRPAALITIDAPDFSFRVAKKLKGKGIPLIHYVAPTVWAWRPKRAKKIAAFLDHLLTLLPFEPPYFTAEGLGCTFVGHSIVESDAAHGDAARFRRKHNVDNAPLLAVLPGSRQGEIGRLMPVFSETLQLLKNRHPDLRIVIPAAPGLAETLKEQTRTWPLPVIITESDQDKYDGFAAARAALACSGTIALELAMARLPAVIAYKINMATFWIVRKLIKVKYANLVNLMHNKEVVPELLQLDCTPEKLAAAVEKLLTDEVARQEQIAGLQGAAAWLGQGQFVPSERAAETVLQLARKTP